MLYGEGSLTGTGQILHKCVGKIWEVRRLTTSLVAWAGVVVSLPPLDVANVFTSPLLNSGEVHSIG
jgi:hypothetical protein